MISFTSVENFFEECTTGIEFDDPFSGIGKVRIHLQDEDGSGYLDDNRCEEFDNLENLVHKYKIGDRTLAEIICDENNIPRTVLPVKRPIEKWQSDLFEGNGNDSK